MGDKNKCTRLVSMLDLWYFSYLAPLIDWLIDRDYITFFVIGLYFRVKDCIVYESSVMSDKGFGWICWMFCDRCAVVLHCSTG